MPERIPSFNDRNGESKRFNTWYVWPFIYRDERGPLAMIPIRTDDKLVDGLRVQLKDGSVHFYGPFTNWGNQVEQWMIVDQDNFQI